MVCHKGRTGEQDSLQKFPKMRHRPVVFVVTAVDVGATLEENGGDGEGGELADRIPAHAGGVSVHCQVKRTVAIFATRLELQEPADIER